MVRIPRSEQQVGYGAQMQPFSSGDGYEAPGKAQQQLGKAIQGFGGQLASLGDSFQADADKEDAYRTQLTSLEYDDKLDRDLTEYKMTADPEKWDQYSAGAAERVGRITQEYMPKLSPKGQQQFSLHAARRHNQIMSSAREHQYDLQRKNLFTRSSAGIDTIAERLYTRYPIESWNRDAAEGIYVPPDPNEIAANAAAALQTQEAIISKYPGTPQQRDVLRKQALDSLGKFVTNNVPPAWQEQVGSAIDAQLRASAPPEAPVVPGTTPQSQMHRWGGGAGQGQMPTYNPARSGRAPEYLRSKLAPGYEQRTSDIDNLHPVMQDRLAAFAAAAEDAGHDIRVVSGHRDAQRQAVLWQKAVEKYGSAAEARKHVAPPGGSSHQSGEAVDLQYGDRGAGLGGKRTAAVEWAHQNAARYGLGFPLGHEDWHIEPVEARAGGKRYGGQYDSSKTFWRPQAGGVQTAGATTGGAIPPEVTQRISPQEYFGPQIDASKLPLGMRVSNNPTNIKYSGSSWQKQNLPGLVGPSSAKDEGDPQAQFANPLAGMVAGAKLALLKNQEQGMSSVSEIIAGPKGWTPGYKAAADHVAKLMGVRSTDRVDLSDPATMQKFMRAVITQEHGESGKLYPDTLISQGVEIAMGRGAPAVAQRGLTRVAALPSTANDAGPQPDYSDAIRIIDQRGDLSKATPDEAATVYRAIYKAGILSGTKRGNIDPDIGSKLVSGQKLTPEEQAQADAYRRSQGTVDQGLVGRSTLSPALAAKVVAGGKLTPVESAQVKQAVADISTNDLVERNPKSLRDLLAQANVGPQPPQNDNAPRAPNTIPAEAGGEQAPVRVADAGGGIPQSAVPGSQPRMLPSGERGVGSHYNEWWREHQAAFRKTQASAIDKLVDQVEASAKETFVHPAAEQIRQQVQYLGDTKMLQRLDRAVEGARIAQGMRTMRPDQVNAVVQGLRSQMGTDATPEQIARLKMMEGVSTTMNTELSKNQLGWAAKAGVIPAPKLIAPETMTVDVLAERAILARQSAQNYGLPPQFFQPEEETRLKAVVEQGGKPLAVMLGMMSKGFGADMPLAVKQIAPKHPEVVQAGWLMANNLNPETAQAIVDGIARRSDPAYKADGPNDLRNKQADTIQQVLGDTFDLYPQQTRDAITRAAEIVYETRNRTPREYNEEMYKKAVTEVLGETDRSGVTYGGVYSQSRGIGSSLKPWSSSGSGGTRNIILPPHIRNDDTSVTTLKQAIATLTPSELAEAGITPPTYRDGRPMPMFKAMAGKFVQADQDGNIGRFTVAHGDPSEEATAAWVLTTPRPFEPVSQADADQRARAKEGADTMGVMPPEGSTVDLVTPPWGSEKSAPLAPTQRWTLDLRPDSALSDILRRKLGRQVFR